MQGGRYDRMAQLFVTLVNSTFYYLETYEDETSTI